MSDTGSKDGSRRENDARLPDGTPTPFSQWLVRRRHDAGMTQADLANRVGIHRVHIHRIERGRIHPIRALVVSLAEALGVETVEALLQAHYLPVDGDFEPDQELSRHLQIYIQMPPQLRQHLLSYGSAVQALALEVKDMWKTEGPQRDQRDQRTNPARKDSGASPTPFGQWLVRHRHGAGLTQTDLAGLVGIHHTRVYRIERGRIYPSRALVARLAEAVGANVTEALLYAHYLPVEDDFEPDGELSRLLQVYTQMPPRLRWHLINIGATVNTLTLAALALNANERIAPSK